MALNNIIMSKGHEPRPKQHATRGRAQPSSSKLIGMPAKRCTNSKGLS